MAASEVATFRGMVGRSPQESYGQNGVFEATRLLKCPWADRNDEIDILATGGGEIYPYRPGTGARAWSATVSGWGKAIGVGGMLEYEQALITVHYSTQAPRLINNKFVVERIQARYDYAQLPPGLLYWDTSAQNPLDVDYRLSLPICGLTYSLAFYNAQSAPVGLLSLIGYCNAAPFAMWTLPITFGAQTLRYTAPILQNRVQLGTTNKITYSYQLDYHGAGWNTKWNPEATTPGWYPVYRADGTPFIQYPLGNFNLLIPP